MAGRGDGGFGDREVEDVDAIKDDGEDGEGEDGSVAVGVRMGSSSEAAAARKLENVCNSDGAKYAAFRKLKLQVRKD